MSVLPTPAAAMDSRTPSTPSAAAGSLPAAAVAEQQALLTNNTHANTTLLARTAVSTMLLDSAVDVHPIGVTPIAASAVVVELQAAEAAPLPSPSSADSTKSLADTSLGSSAQPQAERQQRSGSRDKREKQISSPSHGQIGSDPKAMLLSSSAQSQPAQSQGLNSAPSSSSVAASAILGVGAGGCAAKNSTSTPPSLLAAFAAAKVAFDQRKASPPSSAAHHDDMRDEDGPAAAAASSSSALPDSAKHCLVIDIQQIASSDKHREELNSIRNASLSWQERIAAVLKWLPDLEKDGLVWVSRDPHFPRLHLHFRDHSFLARALKAVPFLVRCCVPSQTSGVWGAHSCPCSGLTRYEQPEALHFTVNPTEDLPAQPALLLSTIKEFIKNLRIDTQMVWQSANAQERQRAGTSSEHPQLSFWVLPREADQNALVALINRVHQKHTLFGGAVHAQGPNNKQTARCMECRELGHKGDICPKFSGIAVRLRFKDPLGPHDFRVLLRGVSGCRSAMLGNTHSEDNWAPSHKATLFFNEPTSDEAIAAFTAMLPELTATWSGRLVDPPALVDMSQAQRKLECPTCGDRNKAHTCLSKSASLSRPNAAQQQHPAAGKPLPAGASAASSASASASVGASAKGATAPKASAAPKPKSLVDGICGEWMRTLHCNRGPGKGCRLQHPQDWVILPNTICHQFAKQGSCQWGKECKLPHITLEELKAQPSTSAAAAAPAPPRKPAATKKQAAAHVGALRENINTFAPLASAAAASVAPTTPRKAAPPSSLDKLASPIASNLVRSTSTPASSAKKKLPSGGKELPARASAASAASAAAATAAPTVDQDGFTTQPKKRRRAAATEQVEQKEEEEEEKQAPKKAAKPAAQKQADAISVSSNDSMEQ